MKKYFAFLPMFVLLIAASCSETTPKEEPKEEPKKPLIEREPEVREYLEVVDELVNEYLTLGEAFLDKMEEVESGEMDIMANLQALSEMGESALKISELTEELQGLEQTKTELEGKLDAEDVIEFGLMFTDKMQRFHDLAKRVEASDYLQTVQKGLQ